MTAYEKIAKSLRADKDTIRVLGEKLSASTGENKVLERIIEENDAIVHNRLDVLGIGKQKMAKEIYDALLRKIESDDNLLFEILGKPSSSNPKDWERILGAAREVANRPSGFFLKREKAIELLEKEPPQNIMRSLGYPSASEMVAKEDIFEIYAALRFIEGNEWLNKVFFKQYENLKPEDFEERQIEVRSLGEKWIKLSESFIKKKYHNISHLKEMGVIFALPLALGISGEIMRNFSLILHYFNEIPFYSNLFRRYAKTRDNFASKIISLLRGDTIDERLGAIEKSRWLIIQRYLSKDDENDWRLFEPHINPEALHWERAEKMMIEAGKNFNHFSEDMAFWQNLNWVGEYFEIESGNTVLVSFNLVDTAMSLIKGQEQEMIKYLYHHQESLWNKIFISYFSEKKMEELMEENILKGYFEI